MNKTFIFTLMLAAFLLPTSPINAAQKSSTSFDVAMTAIGIQPYSTNTIFAFEPTNIKAPEAIDHWKVRVTCESDKFEVMANNLSQDICGKVIKTKNAVSNQFVLTLDNPTGKTVGFSFKLKAYDKNGKWLYSSEEKAFKWK